VVSFGGDAVLRWLVACGVLSAGLVQETGASKSCDSLGIGVQYDQSKLVGLVRSEGAGRDFTSSGLGFFLQWARSVDGI
jgi:hypothetical protein